MATLNITPVSNISADNDVVTAEIFIAAPRERIFAALTDPQQAVRWWGQNGNYRLSEFQMDVRVGGKWSTSGKSEKMGDNVRVEGEFLEIDPPRRLAYTWQSSWMPVVTKVFWELASQPTGTLVKLKHIGFASNVDMTRSHSAGWTVVLGWLQAYSERGETVESRS